MAISATSTVTSKGSSYLGVNSSNTVKSSSNTVKSSSNTVKSSSSTIKSSSNTVKSSSNTVKSSSNTVKSSSNTVKSGSIEKSASIIRQVIDPVSGRITSISKTFDVSISSGSTIKSKGALDTSFSYTTQRTSSSTIHIASVNRTSSTTVAYGNNATNSVVTYFNKSGSVNSSKTPSIHPPIHEGFTTNPCKSNHIIEVSEDGTVSYIGPIDENDNIITADDIIKEVNKIFHSGDLMNDKLSDYLSKKVLSSGTYLLGEYQVALQNGSIKYFGELTVSENTSGEEILQADIDINKMIEDINDFINKEDKNLINGTVISDNFNGVELSFKNGNHYIGAKTDDGLKLEFNLTLAERGITNLIVSKEQSINDNVSVNIGIEFTLYKDGDEVNTKTDGSAIPIGNHVPVEEEESIDIYGDTWGEILEQALGIAGVLSVTTGVGLGVKAGKTGVEFLKELLKDVSKELIFR
ncbi:MAG: hypothetical protein K2M73_05090 [Lachnospiraceae bacterium]|nr:hypothetical protein [Lachnospiraceae bacterium]